MPSPSKTLYRNVEKNQPFESSIIWQWMKNFYSEGGVEVWSEGDVPFHITNTPILASDWSLSILALVRDFYREGQIDPNQPVSIFEIGPGTGRHAYFLLKELQRIEELTQALVPGGLKFCLELGELGERGLAALESHPKLRPYLAVEKLRLHKFDIHSDLWPTPYPAGRTAFEEASNNPVFIINNYILDSLPHDVLLVSEGYPYMGLTSVGVHGLAKDQDPMTIKELGEKIELDFVFKTEIAEYEEPIWNKILQGYAAISDDTYIPFPTGSLRLLERVRKWSKVAAVMLVADKSYTHLEQLVGLECPELVAHGGGFSFNANLHALGLYAQLIGGLGCHTSPRDGTLELSHLVLPASDDAPLPRFQETQFRLAELERFNSIDRFRCGESTTENVKSHGLRLSLDLVRLSGFDPQVFYELSDDILAGLEIDEDSYEDSELELQRILPKCLDAFFPVGDDSDVAFELGRVAYRIESYEFAEVAFRESLIFFGEDKLTRFNLGLTHYYRQNWDEAIEEFEAALKSDSEYEDAKIWLAKSQHRASSD